MIIQQFTLLFCVITLSPGLWVDWVVPSHQAESSGGSGRGMPVHLEVNQDLSPVVLPCQGGKACCALLLPSGARAATIDDWHLPVGKDDKGGQPALPPWSGSLSTYGKHQCYLPICQLSSALSGH